MIPKSMREAAKLEYGDIVCLGMAGGKITVRKVEVIEVGDQSPEAVEAYVRTAFQFMPDSLRLDLIGELSRLLQKRRGKIMQEFTEKDCMQTEKGGIYPEPGGGSSLKGITRALHRAAFSVRISRKQKIPDIPLPIWFLFIYWGGMALLEQGCGWCLCGQNCWGKGTAQLSQIRPFGGAGYGHSQNILDTVFCRMDAMRQGYGW